jgi:hypothetical protein
MSALKSRHIDWRHGWRLVGKTGALEYEGTIFVVSDIT